MVEKAKSKIPEKVSKNIDRVLDLMKSGSLPEVIAKITFGTDGKPLSAWSISNKMFCYTDYIYTNFNKEMSAAKTPEERGAVFMSHLNEAVEKADYRGFNQWKEVKRNIKKGSVSTAYILAPMFRKGTAHYKTIDGKKVQVYGDHKKEEGVTAEEYKFINGFRGIPTFEIAQTAGKEVVYKKLKLPQLPFKPVADFLGIKVIPQSFSGDAYGSFSPSAKVIQLATPDEGTFLHELSHAVDNYLMIKKSGKGLKGGQQADQEIVAEFSSSVLLAILGKKIDQKVAYTKKYVQHYTGKSDNFQEDIIVLMSRIEKVIDFISNFKAAESPTRQMEKKQGEPAGDAEKAANNPTKLKPEVEKKVVAAAKGSAKKVVSFGKAPPEGWTDADKVPLKYRKDSFLTDDEILKKYDETYNTMRLMDSLEADIKKMLDENEFYDNWKWETFDRTYYNTQKTDKYKYLQFYKMKIEMQDFIKKYGVKHKTIDGTKIVAKALDKAGYGDDSNNRLDIKKAGIFDLMDALSGKYNSKFSVAEAKAEAERRDL